MRYHNYFVYILTNKNHTVLYTGVTSNPGRRIWEHQQKINKNSFTARYQVNKLVYFEIFQQVEEAIMREKQIKAGSRKKKIMLIESINHEWKDLLEDL